MTVTTMNPPGTFAWIELGTTDGPGAKEFYTKLFGWDLREAPMGPSSPTTCSRWAAWTWRRCTS